MNLPGPGNSEGRSVFEQNNSCVVIPDAQFASLPEHAGSGMGRSDVTLTWQLYDTFRIRVICQVEILTYRRG